MHWLLVLALLSSTTDIKDLNASGATLNRATENALRQRLGNSVRDIRVDLKRGSKRPGDFDAFDVTLRGFSADRLMELEKNSDRNRLHTSRFLPNSVAPTTLQGFEIGDIMKGPLGDILGGVLNTEGRIGAMKINAGDFSYEGVRYDGLQASLGEIKFNWTKALRGDFDVKSMQSGTLGLQLRGDQAQRLPSVEHVSLRFENGLAHLGGDANFYGLEVPFEVGGRLSVQTNQVRVDDMKLAVAKLRLPHLVINEISKSVNPLYDFDPKQKWPIAVNLTTASTARNVLAMNGGLQWLGFDRGKEQKKKSEKKEHKRDFPFELPLPR